MPEARTGPSAQSDSDRRYVTFEPDCGGLNNIRMAFECVATIAWLTGRSLVIPPPQPWFLVDYRRRSELDFTRGSDFGKVFDIDTLGRQLEVIDAASLLSRLRERPLGGCSPDAGILEARVPQRIERHGLTTQWHAWLRRYAVMPEWNPLHTVLCIPDIESVTRGDIAGHRALIDGRRPVEIDRRLEARRIWHFPADPNRGLRSFGNVLGQVAFADGGLARDHRRFVARSIRYTPEIRGIADSVTGRLQAAGFSALHLRGNEFAQQFPQAMPAGADALRRSVSARLEPGEPLYLATDDPDPDTIAELARDRTVWTWQSLVSDRGFSDLGLDSVSPLVTGPVEQLICAAARLFIGTRFSSFSLYINRLRSIAGTSQSVPLFHSGAQPGGWAGGRDWSYEDPGLWKPDAL